MPDRLAPIEARISAGVQPTRLDLQWMLERLRLLESVVCDFAWSRYEACPACEAGDEDSSRKKKSA